MLQQCLPGLCDADYRGDICFPVQARLSPKILFSTSAFLTGPLTSALPSCLEQVRPSQG